MIITEAIGPTIKVSYYIMPILLGKNIRTKMNLKIDELQFEVSVFKQDFCSHS